MQPVIPSAVRRETTAARIRTCVRKECPLGFTRRAEAGVVRWGATGTRNRNDAKNEAVPTPKACVQEVGGTRERGSLAMKLQWA